MQTLRIVLPDQLDRSVIPRIGRNRERVLMAETGYLFTGRTHRRKLGLLASAGRHYRDELAAAGIEVAHTSIADGAHERRLSELIVAHARESGEVTRLVSIRPGSWSERDELGSAARELGVELAIEEDPHFFATPDRFSRHAAGRKTLVMEYFYRELRREHEILMDGDEPAGGEWNYDKENRDSFGRDGPGPLPAPPSFDDDAVTRAALDEVVEAFPDAPGRAVGGLPVTPAQAEEALARFIDDRLGEFGRYQDAIWEGEPILYHSFISPALNLRLLDPRLVVARAEQAWRDGAAPINSVEGFVRQILGWREFIRGIYYHAGRDYLGLNVLQATEPLPEFFWTGETGMRCVGDVVQSIHEHGYAHHIQRLMIMGLFAMLWGANPYEVHEWHLAFYLDAYDWVSAPNVIGMSQYADGGLLATKPYAASGKYVNRMSNYCSSCRYNPDLATGTDACPFTTLYWDFLQRHHDRLAANRRMKLQVANLDRKSERDRDAIGARVRELRKELP